MILYWYFKFCPSHHMTLWFNHCIEKTIENLTKHSYSLQRILAKQVRMNSKIKRFKGCFGLHTRQVSGQHTPGRPLQAKTNMSKLIKIVTFFSFSCCFSCCFFFQGRIYHLKWKSVAKCLPTCISIKPLHSCWTSVSDPIIFFCCQRKSRNLIKNIY